MPSRVIHVEIHGQRYAVRSELDPQYVGELVNYLDERMAAAAQELATTDPLRIAVVAALNVADELFKARADSVGADGRVRARAAEVERLLDAVLDEARARVVNQ
jgi:cell division protein ZapA